MRYLLIFRQQKKLSCPQGVGYCAALARSSATSLSDLFTREFSLVLI
jgi:hypothetical protein